MWPARIDVTFHNWGLRGLGGVCHMGRVAEYLGSRDTEAERRNLRPGGGKKVILVEHEYL